MSLWIEASRDVEEERRIEAIAAANKALVDVHGIVMQASTAQEFEDRMAVVAERVEGVVASVTASSPMLFPIVHSAVLDGLSIDFDRVQEVRRAEQQRSAAKRAFFRRQRREAMEVTNTEWGIAYMTRSQPYSPAVTLSVSRTDDSVPNQWGGMGIVIKHPEYDGLQFPDMESAKAFTREKGLVRKARTATASRTAAATQHVALGDFPWNHRSAPRPELPKTADEAITWSEIPSKDKAYEGGDMVAVRCIDPRVNVDGYAAEEEELGTGEMTGRWVWEIAGRRTEGYDVEIDKSGVENDKEKAKKAILQALEPIWSSKWYADETISSLASLDQSDVEVIAWARHWAERAGTASVTHVSGPDVLRLCDLAGQPDNETVKWARSCAQAAGDASVSRLSGPDLAKLCDMAEASKTGSRTASRTSALTCPKCKTPVNEGARIFDHGDHEVLKAKCPSCGWSGSKKKPKTKSASVHTAMTQSEADAVLAAVKNPEHRKALEKFTPYLVYGPGYSRGITENFMDAVRFSNRGEDRSFALFFSKLEAGYDIEHGGSNDWYMDHDLGIYTKRLFSSKISGYQDLVEGLSGRYGLAVVKAKEDAAAAGLDPSSDDYWKRVYNQAVWDADYSRLAWAQQGELWTAKTGSLTAEAAQTSPSLVAWGVYDDVRGRVIAEGSARDLATAKQAAEWSIVTKEKGRQLDGPFGSKDEAQKRWEREYEPDSTEVRESSRRTAAVEEFPMVMRDGEWIVPRDVLDKQEYAAFKGGKATLFLDLIVGKAHLVIGDYESFHAEHPELELGSVVIDPRNKTGSSKMAADYTKTPKSVRLKDGTIIPDVMGTDPDPGHPDGKVWIGFDSNGERRKWHNDDVASTDDVEFSLNTSWVDERMDQQRESRRRVAEFPPKKDDEKKPDSANDKTDSDKDGEQDGPEQPGEKPEKPGDDSAVTAPAPNGAQDQSTPTTPTNEGQTDQEQTPSDPTMMDVGQSSSMSYTMSDGGAGSIEVTFVREENGVYFFNGPTGEFGVGQQNGQWQDSAGNTFGFGGQQAPAPAQQAAPAAQQPSQAPQQPPAQQTPPPAAQQPAAPAQDAPPADKGESKDDSSSKDDEKKKDAPPWAKKSSLRRTAVQEHMFPDTGTAYDTSQWNEDIHDGDVLIVPSEGVVGFMLSAWPIAVTEEPGYFHQLNTPGELSDDNYTSARQDGFERAVEIAKQKGWPLHA